ncbi:MAG: hypothetical protein WC506_06030 [Candidatus Micrarchaeia archaeon]
MPAPPSTPRYSTTPSAYAKPPAATAHYASPPAPPKAPAGYAAEDGGRKSSPLLSRLAFALAIISLMLNAYLFLSVSAMKSEARGLIDDLEAMKNIQTKVTVPIKQDIPIQKDIQVASLFSNSVEIPLEFSLPVNGVVTGITPQGLPQSFTFSDQKIPVKTSVPANISIGDGQGSTISINEQIPIDTSLTLTVSAGDAYKSQLDSMISRLQKIAG